MDSINVVFFIIISFFTILPLTTLIHELGHFFFARICLIKNVTLKIGSGRKLLNLRIKDFILMIHTFPFGGATFFETDYVLTRMKRIIISIGGPLLNGVVAVLLILPGIGTGNHFVTLWFQWLALFNLIMCFMNLIPFKVGKYYSDGWIIINVFKSNKM